MGLSDRWDLGTENNEMLQRTHKLLERNEQLEQLSKTWELEALENIEMTQNGKTNTTASEQAKRAKNAFLKRSGLKRLDGLVRAPTREDKVALEPRGGAKLTESPRLIYLSCGLLYSNACDNFECPQCSVAFPSFQHSSWCATAFQDFDGVICSSCCAAFQDVHYF